MGELPKTWRWATLGIVAISMVFIVWKSASPRSDWMAEHLAEFLGAVASAGALAFIAASMNNRPGRPAARNC